MKLIIEPVGAPFGDRGIYGTHKRSLPERMRWLHPLAKDALVRIEATYPDVVHYSDMFRSAESSRARRRITKFAQPPGFSAHNYGLAVDLDVSGTLARMGASKEDLDRTMERYGWYCHRRDHERKVEEWHYNFLGADAMRWLQGAQRSTAAAIESKIQAIYGEQMRVLSTAQLQRALNAAGSSLAVDGNLGPATHAAVAAFQIAWDLEADGSAGIRTQRTLRYVTADKPAS